MNKFNFATVDFTAFNWIVNQLNSKQIFNLALKTNEDVLNRLASMPSTPRNVSLDVTMATERMTISLRFPASEHDFEIAFAWELRPGTAFTVITSRGAAQLLRTLKNVQTLFSGSVSQMRVDLEVLDRQTLRELGDISCEKLTVTGELGNFPCGEVTEALNKIRASEEYCVESDIEAKVLPTLLPSKKLSLKFAEGITRSDLMHMAGKIANIQLRNSTLTSEDVHEFIKLWFESKECATVSLEVRQRALMNWDKKVVLQSLPKLPWQEWMRDRSFLCAKPAQPGDPLSLWDMAHAVDIDRGDKVVGLVGSVLITEHKNRMRFCVWHNPHQIERMIIEFKVHLSEVRQRIQSYPFGVYGDMILIGLNAANNIHIEPCQRAVQLSLRIEHTLNELIRSSRRLWDED